MIDFIKEIDEIIYENFISLQNDIRDRDKNINGTFRITAESLIKYINNSHRKYYSVESDKVGIILSSNKFILGIDREYGINLKLVRILKNIQKLGNDSVHNVVKIFDYNESKENFRYLVFIAQKIYVKETDKTINFSASEIDRIFDDLFNSKTSASIVDDEKITKDDLLNENNKIIDIYKKSNSKEEFYNLDNIEKIYNLLNNFIKYKNVMDTEKLNELGYGVVYKLYTYLNILLSTKYIEDVNDVLYEIEDKLFDIMHLIDSKDDILLFDWIRKSLSNEKENEVENNQLDNYRKIAQEIEKIPLKNDKHFESGRYYITRQKPFIVDDNKYYEIEIQKALDNESKFDRKIVYSMFEINTKYSIKLSYIKSNYDFLGEKSEISILNEWEISIRPCEIYNFIRIFTGKKEVFSKNEKFYKQLNEYLKENNKNLLDIILFNDEKFIEFEKLINDNNKASTNFFNSLSCARDIINLKEKGCNVLRYLLYTMHNFIIKKQLFYHDKPTAFNNLYLVKECLPFDNTPYSAYLVGHKTNYSDLLASIPFYDRECELLAREVEEKCKEEQKLFIPISELSNYSNIEKLVDDYSLLLGNSNARKIYVLDNFIYKKNYLDCFNEIIHFLKNKCYANNQSFDNYKELLTESKILDEPGYVDDENKKYILENLFDNSRIAYIYGEAGSGKTKILTEYLFKIFKDYRIDYVANTHSAKENLRRRVKETNKIIPNNVNFYTAKQYICVAGKPCEKRIVLIDEARVISNDVILKIIRCLNRFEYLVFAGDFAQLDAIDLGNWFDLSSKILDQNMQFDIKTVFRSSDDKLKTLWKKVRNREDDVLEYLKQNNYCAPISNDIYIPADEESEIILCLNYGGMYGVNKINSYFQEKNKNSKEYVWGINKYKIGDKILFNDFATTKYKGVLYNNLKGEIKDIEINSTIDGIIFTLKVEAEISDDDIANLPIIRLSGNSKYTIIQIAAKKHDDKDDDDDKDDAIIPFDIAYALSMHKAQGLQYKSVKIVITPESEEIIDNGIFYTAITRAQEKLKIYWTQSKQNEILDILTKKDDNKDLELYNKLYGKN